MVIGRTNPSFGKPLPRITPEEAGIDPKYILALVEDAKQCGVNFHSFLLLKNDKVFAEAYYAPYTDMQLQTVYSLSKSFTSVAMGLAQEEGILSLDERIVDIFADEVKTLMQDAPSPQMEALTLRDCLRMATGQPQEMHGFDMIATFLNMPFEDMPGERFRYNTMATYMSAATLKKRGIDLEDYLQEKLFTPMGIEGLRWMRCSRGIPTGGYGLSILPEAIAKFGILVKNKGVWEGKRLLPESYVMEATSKRIDNSWNNQGEWAYGYGYQFWMCRDGFVRGDGAFGQYCIFNREKDIVMAATAHTADMQTELDVLFDNIIAHIGEEPLPADPAADEALKAVLQKVACPIVPVADGGDNFPEELLNRTMTFGAAGKEGTVDVGAAKLKLDYKPESAFVRFVEKDGEITLSCSLVDSVELNRGEFFSHPAVFTVNALSFSVSQMETDVRACYGVMDGKVHVRLQCPELLSDVELTVWQENGKDNLVVTDVHLPEEAMWQVLFDSRA